MLTQSNSWNQQIVDWLKCLSVLLLTRNGYARHLVFPVFLFLGVGFSVLGLAPSPGDFWKASALGWVGLLAVAAVDGRWNNHLYHLFSHLESPQAWAAAFTWAAFLVVDQHGTTERGVEAQVA